MTWTKVALYSFFPEHLLAFSKLPDSFHPQHLKMPLFPVTKLRKRRDRSRHMCYILGFPLETLKSLLISHPNYFLIFQMYQQRLILFIN
jgi:hypothetical protein